MAPWLDRTFRFRPDVEPDNHFLRSPPPVNQPLVARTTPNPRGSDSRAQRDHGSPSKFTMRHKKRTSRTFSATRVQRMLNTVVLEGCEGCEGEREEKIVPSLAPKSCPQARSNVHSEKTKRKSKSGPKIFLSDFFGASFGLLSPPNILSYTHPLSTTVPCYSNPNHKKMDLLLGAY